MPYSLPSTLSSNPQSSDQYFASAFEHASIGMALVAPDGRWLQVNRALCAMLGYSEAEILLTTFQDITHPDDLEADLEYVRRLLAGDINSFQMEKRYFHKQGRIVWSLLSVSLVKDAAGRPLHFISQVQDVTHRKQAEEALRASEQRYRMLFANNPLPMWVFDLETLRFLAVNTSAVNHYGYSEAEFLAMTLADIRPPEDVPELRRAIASVRRGGSMFGVWRHRKKSGELIYVELATDEFIFDGRPARLVLAHDVTQRRRAEERIAEQAALLDKAQDAIVVCNPEQGVLFWNKGAERLYGWVAEEVVGRNIGDVLYRDPVPLEQARRLVVERGEWSGELLHQSKEGTEVRVESRWSLLHDAEGRPKSFLSINTDITEKKKLESQFLRAQRMESIGTLAGGIAHDLNNVLAPIMMSIDLLRTRITDPASRETLALISSSAKRGAEMVSQVLGYARGIEGERAAIDPSVLLRDLEHFVRETFPKNIEFRTAMEPDPWPITGDATQLYQVMLNLCVNARDAMPEGGRLTVSARNTTIGEQPVAESMKVKAGRFVVFRIEDTGSGMPQEIVDKIFDPFFTTKGVGKGTGLGLSTSLAIIKSHGGFLQVFTEPGLGTRFEISLPAGGEQEACAAAVERAELPYGRGETVLLVDDEASIRQVVGQTLETFGYQVLTAENGSDALAVFAQHGATIAAVLTDMMMPVMDGPALIGALRRLAPGLPIIAASGVGVSRHVARAADEGVELFVPKPYTAESLLTVLATVLRGQTGTRA